MKSAVVLVVLTSDGPAVILTGVDGAEMSELPLLFVLGGTNAAAGTRVVVCKSSSTQTSNAREKNAR
jgi:hypothetical protein